MGVKTISEQRTLTWTNKNIFRSEQILQDSKNANLNDSNYCVGSIKRLL